VQRKGGLIAVKSRISGKEAVYGAREIERRRPVKLLASDRVDGVSVATNPQLRFRYRPADEHVEPLDGGEPTEV
jgi:hypothetical protein